MIEAVALDAEEIPALLDAVTLKVYAVEDVSPLMVILPDPDWAKRPTIELGDEVVVYVSIVAPPLLAGAKKVIKALVGERAVAVPIVGAPGTVTVGVATNRKVPV